MHGAGNPPSRADGVYQVVEMILCRAHYFNVALSPKINSSALKFVHFWHLPRLYAHTFDIG